MKDIHLRPLPIMAPVPYARSFRPIRPCAYLHWQFQDHHTAGLSSSAMAISISFGWHLVCEWSSQPKNGSILLYK